MYVRNCWYVAAWEQDLEAGALLARTLLGEPIVYYRKRDGALVALQDRCVHRNAPLSLGRREGDDVRCMYHGLRFAPSGRCVEIPGFADKIPDKACVRSYPVVSRHGWIWTWMGDPALASPDLIPAAVGPDDPHWVLATGQLDYDASYELINDNLTDLSHLSYVHTSSFGADSKWADTRPEVTALERGVRVARWIEGTAPIPRLGAAAKHDAVDLWATYDFVAPGVFLMLTSLHPTGTARKLNGAAPEEPSLFAHFTSQAVSPVTERTSRYFFSWGPRREHGDDAVARAMLDVAMGAFMEDKRIIEAQQLVLKQMPDSVPMPIPADRSVMLFQRTMRRLAQGAPIAG